MDLYREEQAASKQEEEVKERGGWGEKRKENRFLPFQVVLDMGSVAGARSEK